MPEDFKAKTFTDYVGRPRKLSGGSIVAITKSYYEGKSTRDLAEEYGVSRSLILTICYHTPRKNPK